MSFSFTFQSAGWPQVTSYKVKPDPCLLQSDIMAKGVSLCEVRRLIPFSQSTTICFLSLWMYPRLPETMPIVWLTSMYPWDLPLISLNRWIDRRWSGWPTPWILLCPSSSLVLGICSYFRFDSLKEEHLSDSFESRKCSPVFFLLLVSLDWRWYLLCRKMLGI